MEEDIKQGIMKAMLRLLETRDIKMISIREIAKEAGVNSAAISYYFGGKDQLFFKVMDKYWNNVMDMYLEILDQKKITTEQAETFCMNILNYEMKSTGIVRSEQGMYMDSGIDEATANRIKIQFKALKHFIVTYSPNTESEMVLPKVLMLSSSLTCPAFWSELTEIMIEQPIEEFKKAYVKQLVKSIRN